MYNTPAHTSLITCLEECPGAIFTYYLLYKHSVDNELFVHKEDVERDYHTDTTLFAQELSELKSACLIDFKEDSQSYYILFPLKVSGEGKILC